MIEELLFKILLLPFAAPPILYFSVLMGLKWAECAAEGFVLFFFQFITHVSLVCLVMSCHVRNNNFNNNKKKMDMPARCPTLCHFKNVSVL